MTDAQELPDQSVKLRAKCTAKFVILKLSARVQSARRVGEAGKHDASGINGPRKWTD